MGVSARKRRLYSEETKKMPSFFALLVAALLAGCVSEQSGSVVVHGKVETFDPSVLVLHREDFGGITCGSIASAQLSSVVILNPARFAARKLTIRLPEVAADRARASFLRTPGALLEFELPLVILRSNSSTIIEASQLKWPNSEGSVSPERETGPGLNKPHEKR